MSVETLDSTSVINIVQDTYGSNKYALNGSTTYNSNLKYSLDIGTYSFNGIPSNHPLSITDISDSNFLTYTGLIANKVTVSGIDYYTGNVTIQVTGNFGTASIKCLNHGYMGGQDLFKYVTVQETVSDTSGNSTYVNSSVYTSSSSKITKKYYKDLTGNSQLFFNEKVRIKSNNIICSNSNTTIEIDHIKSDEQFIIGSKPSNGTSPLVESKNGKFWSQIPNTIFTHVRGIAYSPESELWIACGSGTSHTLAYSINGTNWIGLGKTIFGDVAYSVAYANNKWVAVGGNTPNTIAYSSNGINWTGVGNTIFTNCGKAIGYGNGLWVAGGQGTNSMAYSVDGINWTGLGKTIFDEQCNVVKYADNMWVAGGGNDIPNTLAYSTDGINWTGGRYNNIRYYTHGVDYANGLWIAGGGQKAEAYAGDTSTNWVLVSDSIPDWNGGFEDPVVSSYGTLEDSHSGLAITGWSWFVPSNAGTSALYGPSFGKNPWNGTPIAGSGDQQVGLRLQQSLTKTVTGILKHGSDYQIKLMAITRYGQYNQTSRPDPTIKVYYNGTEISEFSLRMMDGDLPVLIDNILFTASGNNHEFTFEHQHDTDYTMMMDDIQLFEDTNSDLDISASDLSGIDISASNVGTTLSGSWILKSSTMTNWNGGFETDILDVNHFVKIGRDDPFGGVLTGWTYTKGDHTTWGPTLMSGNNSGFGNQAIIHGTQIIGLRYGQTLSKTMSGLSIGKSYKLRYQRHARVGQTSIEYRLYLGDTSNILKQETVTTAAIEVEANRLIEIDFVPQNASETFTLEHLTGEDNIIWFDKFELYEDQSSGSFDISGLIIDNSNVIIDFGVISKIPSGTIGLETANDNAFDNNWTTNYDNTVMLNIDFNTLFDNQGLSIALAGDAGSSTNYAPNTGPLTWHFNVDSVTSGLQSNQTLIPGVYNATYSLTIPNTTYTKALGIGAADNKGVIVSKTFADNSIVYLVYGYGRIDSTTGADLGGTDDGASAIIKVNSVQIDSTTDVQKDISFNVNSGETMEIIGSLLLYSIEFETLPPSTDSGPPGFIGWKKVFRQDDGYLWTSGSESSVEDNMKNNQLNTETDDNYSIMNEIYNSSTRDNYKYNGVYKFKMVNTQGYELIWTQTGNPFDHIDELPGTLSIISWKNYELATGAQEFDGLHIGNETNRLYSVLDGIVGAWGRYCIGMIQLWSQIPTGKIPTISTENDHLITSDWVELYSYVVNGNASSIEFWDSIPDANTRNIHTDDYPNYLTGKSTSDYTISHPGKLYFNYVGNSGVGYTTTPNPLFESYVPTNSESLDWYYNTWKANIPYPQYPIAVGVHGYDSNNPNGASDIVFEFHTAGTVQLYYGTVGVDRRTGQRTGTTFNSSGEYGDVILNKIDANGIETEIERVTVVQKKTEIVVSVGEKIKISEVAVAGINLFAFEFYIASGSGDSGSGDSGSGDSGSTGGVSYNTSPTWSLISDSITDWNGGFEDDVLSSNSFKKYGHDDSFGGTITGWTYTKGTHSTWGPTLLNGNSSGYGNQAILHGSQVIGLRYNQTLTKSLTGLTAGKRYKLSYQRHNRVGQTDIQYKVYSGEETNVYLSETVTTASSEAEANRLVEIIFIPFDTTHSFTIKQLNGGDIQSWFDKFELYEDTSGYSAGSAILEYPPPEMVTQIKTNNDNTALNRDGHGGSYDGPNAANNGETFTCTISGASHGDGAYTLQTSSNKSNSWAHHPRHLIDKDDTSSYGFLYNWGCSSDGRYNSDGTVTGTASEKITGVNGEWAELTLPESIVPYKYYIRDRNASPSGNATPLSWKIYGYNGTSYDLLDSHDDYTELVDYAKVTMNIVPTNSYSKIVLIITKVNNKTWFGLSEFKVFGVSASSFSSSGGDSGESAYTWATPAGPPYDLTVNVLKPYTGDVVSRPYVFEDFYKDAVEVSESSSEIPATTTTPAGDYKTYKFGDEYIRTGVLNLYFNGSTPMYNYISAFFDRMDSGNTSFDRKGRYIFQSNNFTNTTFADITVNGAVQYFTFLSSDTTKVSYIRVFRCQDTSAYFDNYTPSELKIYGTNDDSTTTLLATNTTFKTDLQTNATNATNNNLYTNYSFTKPDGNVEDDIPAYVDITLDSSAETTGYKKYYLAYSGSVGAGRMLGGWVQFYYNLPTGGSSGGTTTVYNFWDHGLSTDGASGTTAATNLTQWAAQFPIISSYVLNFWNLVGASENYTTPGVRIHQTQQDLLDTNYQNAVSVFNYPHGTDTGIVEFTFTETASCKLVYGGSNFNYLTGASYSLDPTIVYKNGTQIDSTLDIQKILTFDVVNGDVIKVWEDAGGIFLYALEVTTGGSSESTPGWKKVFRQTAPYLWTSGTESSPLDNMKNNQLNTESDDNYSIMNEIFNSSTRDNYKYNSVYKFKMVNTQGYELTWTQTGNPFDHNNEAPGTVSNISAANFSLSSNDVVDFDGLHVSQTYGILDGVVGLYGRYLIGQARNSSDWNGVSDKMITIPTNNADITHSDWVELYAYVSDSGSGSTPDPHAATHSFILTGASKSLTDVNNSNISLELIGYPTFSEANGVELTGTNSQYIKIPQSVMDVGTNDYTLSLWIKNAVTGSGERALLSMESHPHRMPPRGGSVIKTNSSGLVQYRSRMLNPATTSPHTNNAQSDFVYGGDSDLHNYVVSRKGTVTRLFIDDVERASFDDVVTYPTNEYDDNYIGMELSSDSPAKPLTGDVTKFEVWLGSGYETWPPSV